MNDPQPHPAASIDPLPSLGWTPARETQALERAGASRAALQPARVGAVHADRLVLYGASEPHDGDLPAWLARAADPLARPGVGDWVLTRARPGAPPLVEHLLPREGSLTRSRPDGRAQLIAANVDVALICSSLDRDLNPRRLERYLLTVAQGEVPAHLLLTKCDLVDDEEREAALARIRQVAGAAPVTLVSPVSGEGMAVVEAALGAGQTGVVIGSSGVGKSTLLNRLLGEQRQLTQPSRADDQRGRHTTTHRELFALPSGGWLIDTPGMRELGLWFDAAAPSAGLEATFADIEALAASCRYRDCQHEGEPGCAVNAATDSGELDPDRLASWGKLRRELARQEARHDPKLAREQRNMMKARGKMYAKHSRKNNKHRKGWR